MKTCHKCNIQQDLFEFYCKDKKTGRLSNKCRTCEAIEHGIVFPGKLKYLSDLLEDGKMLCSDCKQVKPLSEYYANVEKVKTRKQICKVCNNIRLKPYVIDGKKNLSTHYLKQYLKSNYNLDVKDATPELLDIARLEIQIKRESKFFLDGKSFVTLRDFARYVRDNYGMGIFSTEARIRAGHTERQCTVSEYEHRSEFVGKSKGKVIVEDVETKEIRVFRNRSDLMKKYNITMEVISRCIDTGEIRKPYLNSKNRKILKIQRYEQV